MRNIKSLAVAALLVTGVLLSVSSAEAKQAAQACRITFTNGGYLQGTVVDNGANCLGTAYTKSGQSLGSAITEIPVRNN